MDARDTLESLVRRGGTRGRRIATSLRALDERFERATLPDPSWLDDGRWWRGRLDM
jgi:hypothetical protein